MKAPLTQQRQEALRLHVRLALAAACAAALATTGCFWRRAKVQPFPWAVAASTRPHPPVPPFDDIDLAREAPELRLEVPAPPSTLVAIRSTPARPRIAPASPAAPPETPSKPEVPQIAPQLSAAEANAAQQQTTASLTVAERNIGATQGRNLNAGQLDLASKVRSFIAEAREAANVGDWTRARNAAKKAQVLSEELANSM